MFRCCTNVACIVLVALSLTSCKSKVPANPDGLAQLQTATNTAQADVPAQIGERFDPAQEESVSNESLKAWRIALRHRQKGSLSDAEWKKLRTEDEKTSMAMLKDLHERYPKNSTVHLMMGQVAHEFGNEAAAVEFYEEAIAKNRGSSLYVFKLAEAARTAGDTRKAIKNYRQLLVSQPDFAAGQIGLAKSLLKDDPKSVEARELIQRVLDREANNADALEVKKQILSTK